jgi:hypothetical protein
MPDYRDLLFDVIQSIDAETSPENQGWEFTQETCEALDRARDELAAELWDPKPKVVT